MREGASRAHFTQMFINIVKSSCTQPLRGLSWDFIADNGTGKESKITAVTDSLTRFISPPRAVVAATKQAIKPPHPTLPVRPANKQAIERGPGTGWANVNETGKHVATT